MAIVAKSSSSSPHVVTSVSVKNNTVKHKFMPSLSASKRVSCAEITTLALIATTLIATAATVAGNTGDISTESGLYSHLNRLSENESDFSLWGSRISIDNGSNTVQYFDARKRNLSYAVQVNPFWLQFPQPSAESFQIMAIIYIIISSIGGLGNAFVLFMFLRFRSLRTTSNVLIINLTVSDLLMLAKCPIAIYNNFMEGPALGDWGCRIYGFIGGLTGTTSIITLTAIAVDRYNVVVHPLDSLRQSTKNQIRCTLIMIWLYSFSFSVVPALDIGLSVYVPEGFLTTCSFDYLDRTWKARCFMFTFFVCAWCVPFVTIVYCYVYILKEVRSASAIQSSKNKFKTEIKLSMVIFVIIILWFLAWTPYSVVALLGITGNEGKLTPLSSMIPALFCKSSACIDPYIYAVTHPRFRTEFQRLLHGGLPARRSSTLRSSLFSKSTNTKSFQLRPSTTNESTIRESTNQTKSTITSIIDEGDELNVIVDVQQQQIHF